MSKKVGVLCYIGSAAELVGSPTFDLGVFRGVARPNNCLALAWRSCMIRATPKLL